MIITPIIMKSGTTSSKKVSSGHSSMSDFHGVIMRGIINANNMGLNSAMLAGHYETKCEFDLSSILLLFPTLLFWRLFILTLLALFFVVKRILLV